MHKSKYKPCWHTIILLTVYLLPLIGFAKDSKISKVKVRSLKIKKKVDRPHQGASDEQWLKQHLSHSPNRDPQASQTYFPFIPNQEDTLSLVSTVCEGIGQDIVALYGTRPQGYRWTPPTVLVLYSYDGKKRFVLDLRDSLQAISNEADFASPHIMHALVRDEILYVSLSHKTYAKATKGKNAYIQAFDLQGRWLWNSDYLVANANNFLILGDHLITGYGFTAEADYLYQLNRYTGKTLKKYKLKNGPNWFAYKAPGQLHILTYNRDMILQLTQ